MVSTNDEIVIVNFDETTPPDNKPRLTYRLAEKVVRQVCINAKKGLLRYSILMCIKQIGDPVVPPLNATTVDEVILNVDTVREETYLFSISNNGRVK